MSSATEGADYRALLESAFLKIKELRAQLEAQEGQTPPNAEPIAIVGMGCRFPGDADTPEKFWQLLADGVDTVTEVPAERWNVDDWYDPDPEAPGKVYTRSGAFLREIDRFDPSFFDISPRDALSLDPQQRLLLEVSWEALENAALAPSRLRGSRTGVFMGLFMLDYGELDFWQGGASKVDAYNSLGILRGMAAGRLAYLLDLHGPAMQVDTACSSSLLAVHLACQSLRLGESEVALAGGVNLTLAAEVLAGLCKMKAAAVDGRCKSFDAAADGYGRGEGCGVVVLKRLSTARADGDRVLAVIRGSAASHDGRSNGLTAPNGLAQELVIREALANARVEPQRIQYVEAHGTGTPLGDPIEISALSNVLCQQRGDGEPLHIGTVKSNMGHLESAAGMPALIKTVLALQHGQIPPNLHFNTPNPRIPWDDLPIRVPVALTRWPEAGSAGRLAGINSFGMTGTNVHLIVEEAVGALPRDDQPLDGERPLQLLALSAKDEAALKALAARYRDHLDGHPEIDLADLCFTANSGRDHFAQRLAVTASSPAQLRDELAAYAAGAASTGWRRGCAALNAPEVVFLFTGQGAQYPNMGRELYRSSPLFRRVLERCNEILLPELEVPLLDLLYPADDADPATSLLDETAYTQPALFALEYALAQLWRSWGIQPAAVMGHSVGEYVAACVAGVFSLEEGLKLIAARGRLMQGLTERGGMLAAMLDEGAAEALVAEHGGALAIAALNGPSSVVLSGRSEALAAVAAELHGRGVQSKPLRVSHAFHSPLMEPMLEEFRRVAQAVSYAPPQLRLISNLSGDPATAEVASAEYWCRHIRQPVRFRDGVETLHRLGYGVYLEIGPKPVLSGMGRQCLPEEASIAWLPTLRPGRTDWESLLESLGDGYLRGLEIDWAAFDREYRRRKIDLPTYPFQRERFWIDAPASREKSGRLGALIDQMMRLPWQNQILFECRFGVDRLPLLADHKVYGAIVSPAACQLSMVLSGMALAFDSTRPGTIEDIVFPQPLSVPDDPQEAPTVHLVLTPEEGDAPRSTFRLISFHGGHPQEKPGTHASGVIDFPAGEEREVALESLQQRYPEAVDVASIYAAAAQRQILLGPEFRWLSRLWRGADGALGKLRAPATLGGLTDYVLHPGILDACFQVAGSTVNDSETRLPFAIERFRLHRPARGQEWWCHAEQRGEQKWDIGLFDADGRRVAEIVGFEVRSAPQGLSQSLYALAWEQAPLENGGPEQEAMHPASAAWVVFGADRPLTAALVDRLGALGRRVVLVQADAPADVAGDGDVRRVTIDAERPEAYRQLLAGVMSDGGCAGVVYLWGMEGPPAAATPIPQQTVELSTGLLHLTQAMAELESGARLWLVTRGCQHLAPPEAGGEGAPADLADAGHRANQGALWGLARTVHYEYPQLHCGCIDLTAETPPEATAWVDELLAEGPENQLVYRGDQRHVARLLPWKPAAQAATQPQQARLAEYGAIDHLQLVPLQRRAPGPGEVEIEVRVAGLNFRDVLNTLGMLQQYYAESLDIHQARDIPLGFECAGVVVAVGEGVTGLAVGDAVMGTVLGSLADYAVASAELLAPIPAGMSFEEAATIPLAFLTAWYALKRVVDLQPEERILIHAAAGGVGQAAVQIARATGAELFATASPPKWEFLKGQGVTHVMNSRTLDFAEEVMALTDGRGVDVVLNSLTGEVIERSLSLLGDGGRFVEIGKLEIRSAEQVAARHPGVRYFSFDLADAIAQDERLLPQMWRELLERFADGRLQPLPYKPFAKAEIGDAFRYMQQARHLGKVVLTFARDGGAANALPLKAEASYLITGGLGGLGLHIARTLVEGGARQLVLSGRRDRPSADAAQAIRQLEEDGATIHIVAADIGDPEAVRSLVERCQEIAPLKGVVHAAGVLDDGVLGQQSRARFEKVMAPKVAGSWYLHQSTQGLPLDFLVCFSSVASLLGSPGQGNYAAANGFMDALMRQRRDGGLPGIAIHWGPWGEVGMAVEQKQRMQAQGIGLIAPQQGTSIFTYLLENDATGIGVLPVNWSRYPTTLPLLAHLQGDAAEPSAAEPADAFLQQLESAPPEERLALLEGHLQEQVAHVLGQRDHQRISTADPFSALGVDSLMSVELRNQLQKSLGGHHLPATIVFDYPSIAALAAHLLQEIVQTPEPTAEAAPAEPDRPAAEAAVPAGDAVADLLWQELMEIDTEKEA
ncbi:SDR family NAD(P)-dependent oxidoreductase [Endothiovibrio diazotrophicus]